MSDNQHSIDDINKAVESAFILCKKVKEDKKNNPLKKLDDLIYSREDNYIHYYPKELIIKLTSNCNLRCKHCFFSDKLENYSVINEIEPKIFLKHIKNLVEETGITQCKLSGGEIFTSPIIRELLEFLKSKNIALNLITNATLIDEKTVEWLAKILNPKYDIIQISMEGANVETNDNIRGIGSFAKIINAIKQLRAKNQQIEIGYTINSLNVSQIAEYYNLSKELGISQINFGKFALSNKNQEYLVPNIDDIFINLAKLLEIYDGNPKLQIRALKVPDFLNYEVGKNILDKELELIKNMHQSFHCSSHHEKMAIFPNGDITFCYACEEKDLVLGNINKEKFSDIWKRRFSNPMFQERTSDTILCKNCKYLSLCFCGCPHAAYKKFGTINAPAFDCKYFKEISRSSNEKDN